jgi:hypothetical protein
MCGLIACAASDGASSTRGGGALRPSSNAGLEALTDPPIIAALWRRAREESAGQPQRTREFFFAR